MKTSCYLLVKKNGAVEFRKTSYSSKIGQIPIKINIELPDSLFKDPIITGNLKLTEEEVRGRKQIELLEFELKQLKKRE